MKPSPFQYGSTVSTTSFTNREAECLKLKQNLQSGVNTMLISPRRWGKSSLVEKVMGDIRKKDKDTRIVMIDLFSVNSETEFLETYAREVIKATSGKWQEWLKSTKELFRQLIPKISIGIDPMTDFSISFDTKELHRYSEEILNLPEVLAQRKKIKIIVCLDEFQSLANFPEYELLERKMRSVWQRQKFVTYCLYGSKRHMMTDIFNNPSKPFYRFGDIMLLSKIEEKRWISFLIKSFESGGKKIQEPQAKYITQLMKCHSWYIQQLAHYTYNNSPKEATMANIEKAMEELLYANSPLYQKEVENMSTTQLNMLKAIAKGETQLTSTNVMQTYNLGTPNNVTKNKVVLIGNDIVFETQGKYEFIDPAFECWFNETYFRISWKRNSN